MFLKVDLGYAVAVLLAIAALFGIIALTSCAPKDSMPVLPMRHRVFQSPTPAPTAKPPIVVPSASPIPVLTA